MPKRRRNVIAKPNKARARPPKSAAAAKEAAPLADRVLERGDGFYWERVKGEAHGPYASRAEAEAEMLADGAAADDEELEVPQALQEAESELGISEWIDPDTGGPAEDNVPRIEDH
jgi:ribonuclease HI